MCNEMMMGGMRYGGGTYLSSPCERRQLSFEHLYTTTLVLGERIEGSSHDKHPHLHILFV
jgi:hypothetical protein